MSDPNLCPVCKVAFRSLRHPWLFGCPSCGFLAADLDIRIASDIARQAIDEDKRTAGLQPLRRAAFERVLDLVATVSGGRAGRLLDVGCAHGWFLEAAAGRGFEACGIEPDVAIGNIARSHGLVVWSGLFPGDVPPDHTFDVIVFNDVFEHLPDPLATLAACRRLLAPGGLLVISIPSSAGLFYRLADLLDRFGIDGPFERMWQKNFASPHLFYTTPEHLKTLAGCQGFGLRHLSALPSVEIRGLWARLRYDRSSSPVASAAVWLAVVLLSPLLKLLPADIMLAVFAKGEGP